MKIKAFVAAVLTVVLLFWTGAVPAGQSAAPDLQVTREGVIRGFTFDDLNKNGVRDLYEPGVAETVVCLVPYAEWEDFVWDGWGCDHTEWGEYDWDYIESGTYMVYVVDVPEGYFVISPNPLMVVMPEGRHVAIINFALSNDPDGLIRARTFVDEDRDRTRDPLEPGLENVRVCLIGSVPNWCNYTEYGEAEFDMLPPGTYTLEIQEFPRGYHPIPPRTVTITLADAESRTVDFGFRKDNRRVR